jgi:hypothetical protein
MPFSDYWPIIVTYEFVFCRIYTLRKVKKLLRCYNLLTNVSCFIIKATTSLRYAVVQSVEELRYKPEGSGFESLWGY